MTQVPNPNGSATPRISFENADEADDLGLRRLFAETPMGQDMEISFQREPYFFYATKVQGRFYQVSLARDRNSGTVIGCGTRTVKPCFVNGKVRDLGYLADLRLRREYRSGILVPRAYQYLRQLHEDQRTDIYFTAIFDNNETALRTITSGRAGLPQYYDLGRFNSYAISLRRTRGIRYVKGGAQVVRGTMELLPDIVDCLNRNGSRKQFAPFYSTDDFLDNDDWLVGFHIEDFYVAVENNRVVGVLGKWDQRAFKQTLVVGYQGKLKLLRAFYNIAARCMGLPTYPPPGHKLDFFYSSFIAVDQDDLYVFGDLLRRLYEDSSSGEWPYFLLGLHTSDPLAHALRDYHVVPVGSHLYCVCYEDGEETYRELDGRVPHIEIAML